VRLAAAVTARAGTLPLGFALRGNPFLARTGSGLLAAAPLPATATLATARLLARGGGKYFADGKLTVADLKAFVHVRWLRSGSLDHVPTDLVERLAPALVSHQERIEAEPRVTAYYAART